MRATLKVPEREVRSKTRRTRERRIEHLGELVNSRHKSVEVTYRSFRVAWWIDGGVAGGKAGQYSELTLDGGPGNCLRLAREECVPCLAKTAISTTCPAFEVSSKRRKSFPSETRVKRGDRVVHGEVELIEKLGRNDLCPCGSGRRFQTMLC
jgi:SEC-C motif